MSVQIYETTRKDTNFYILFFKRSIKKNSTDEKKTTSLQSIITQKHSGTDYPHGSKRSFHSVW